MSSRPSRGAARLAAILDALPDALLLVNCNGTVVNANTIALETFESPGTGLVGRGLLDLLPSFDSNRIPGSMRRPSSDQDAGRTKPTRMIARRTDGSEFPVEVTSANLEDPRTPYADPYDTQHNSYTGDELLMLVVRDLTGTVDNEIELARQQRQTEMILRAAAEGVVGVDNDGKVVLVNPAAVQILGYRASDLGGKDLHPLIHHSRTDGTPLPYEETPLADTLRSGRKHRVRGQALWAKDGRPVPVDMTTAPVRDGDQLVGAVMTFTDRRAYDALSARHDQLLAVLDTSLRGPLDELRSDLGTLADDPAGQLWPEANQILHHLAAGYARMTTLVDNVLSYQRLDSGSEQLERVSVSLEHVVAAGVEGAIELIGPGRAQFAVHAPPIEAEVDPDRMAQALAHLIADVAGVDATGNTPPGTITGDSTIVVAAAQRGEVVRIEVRGPYSGGDPVHEPIVRGIVRRHGGVLQTHEVPGMSGSAYVLEVPLAAEGGTAGERDRDAASTATPAARERTDGTGNGRKSGGGGDTTGGGFAPVRGGQAAPGRELSAGTAGSNARQGAAGNAVPAVPGQSAPGAPAGRAVDPRGTVTGREPGHALPALPPAGPQITGPQTPGPHSQLPGPRADVAQPTGTPRPALPARRTPAPHDVPPEAAANGARHTGAPAAAENDAPAAAQPTGRRRGRPSPAEEQGAPPYGAPGAEGQVPGARSGRRARHGGAEQPEQQPHGALATAPEWQSEGAGPSVPRQGTGADQHVPTGRRARRPQPPAPAAEESYGQQATAMPALPPGAAAGAPEQSGGPAGLSPVPQQSQGQPPTGRRARRALAEVERPVPEQGQPGAGAPPQSRGPFALPPAAADQARNPGADAPGAPGQPPSWPAQGEAEPQPGGRRRARRPAEEQQPQIAAPNGNAPHRPDAPVAEPQTAHWGEPSASAPHHGAPSYGQDAAPGGPQQGYPAPGAPAGDFGPEGPVDDPNQSRSISVRTLGQGVPFAQQVNEHQQQRRQLEPQAPPQNRQPHPGQPAEAAGMPGAPRPGQPEAQQSAAAGRRRKLAAPPDEGDRTPPSGTDATGRPPGPRGGTGEQQAQPPGPQGRLRGGPSEGRSFAIGAPDEGAEGPEPLDGPNGAIDVTDAHGPPMDDEMPPEPLDNPRRLLVWPAPDVSTQQALSDRGYRPVIVHSREEVDAQIAAYPAALFVDPLTGPITRTALQSLRAAAVSAEVPVLVTAGLGQATREAAYGADPAVLLKALAPRDSDVHPPRVLLIESHDDIANALAATLERRGMQVARASGDADAVELASRMRPNLVVMDLMQIRRRRAGIVDWLRANGLLDRTPLVVYTAADIDPEELPRLGSGETVLFLAERSTSTEVQGRIVDLLAKIGN